jgi:hypothetical protein
MSEQSSALKWPGDVELFEPSVNQSTYFNGIRAVAVDGIVAHLSLNIHLTGGTAARNSWSSAE